MMQHRTSRPDYGVGSNREPLNNRRICPDENMVFYSCISAKSRTHRNMREITDHIAMFYDRARIDDAHFPYASIDVNTCSLSDECTFSNAAVLRYDG